MNVALNDENFNELYSYKKLIFKESDKNKIRRGIKMMNNVFCLNITKLLNLGEESI